ncbi:hypothetical protein [uncultured Friedmanniella sp.]|uniref:hypothetical protein n=1 Tax=uncultured Friedmanniella sp. TaxID=335381 RepID=UPI0035C9841A
MNADEYADRSTAEAEARGIDPNGRDLTWLDEPVPVPRPERSQQAITDAWFGDEEPAETARRDALLASIAPAEGYTDEDF